MPVSRRREAAPAAAAFDELCVRHAAALIRQTYLLTGRPRLARRAVERGFRLAWQRWPEVAAAPDPAGWVRAAAYEYALTPWHRLCPGLRTARSPERLPGSASVQPAGRPLGPAGRALLEAVLALPAPYRRVLLLHDGVGLGLRATAAEVEASGAATAGRLAYARQTIAVRLPELGLGGQPPERRGDVVRGRLGELLTRVDALLAAEEVEPPGGAGIRADGERGARRTTLAALGLTGLFVLVTLLAMVVTPGHGARPRPWEGPRVAVPAEPRVAVSAEPPVMFSAEPRVPVLAEPGVMVSAEPRVAVPAVPHAPAGPDLPAPADVPADPPGSPGQPRLSPDLR
ncbi:hypothetical protein [Streptomyces sp. NBRC 110611]|uniref:hypothetical protein n=1 Tax=Streptomyces sp. NBRC 110611 TaxID=1621259 RepID=UPI0039836C9C